MSAPPSIDELGFSIKGFKCFDDWVTISPLPQIGVIIGRNNTGKSALLEAISAFLTCDLKSLRRDGKFNPQVRLSRRVDKNWCILPHDVNAAINTLEPRGDYWANARMPIGTWIDRFCTIETYVTLEKNSVDSEGAEFVNFTNLNGGSVVTNQRPFYEDAGKQITKLHARLVPKDRFHCIRIAADRDVRPEDESVSGGGFFPDGTRLTGAIREQINNVGLDKDLVQVEVLRDINRIFNPDCHFQEIFVQSKGGIWEIYVKDATRGYVPIRDMGSGFKTVLMVVATIHMLASEDALKVKQLVFLFEELENNLHPATQRRLLRYLRDIVEDRGCSLIMTTHSNVTIDVFSKDPVAKIYHLENAGSGPVTLAEAGCFKTFGKILDDLGVRASDVLQANVVIWVEGPSDRNYVRRWIELMTNGALREGDHFSIMMVGGSSNAHYSLKCPDDVDDLIPAIRVGRHVVLLLDSDQRDETTELKEHTRRLEAEVNVIDGLAWITHGKEIENYIPDAIWEQLGVAPPAKYQDAVAAYKELPNKKSCEKVKMSKEICERWTLDMVKGDYELFSELGRVVEFIRHHNHMDPDRVAINK